MTGSDIGEGAAVGLSIGGGLGPVGGRIGTRGVGVRVGPVSASTGWGRRRRASSTDNGALTFVLVVVGGFFGLAWPYLLATYVAVHMGAGRHSATRSVVGWSAEVLYALAVIAVFVAWRRRLRENAEAEAAERAEEARRHHARQIERARTAAVAMRAALESGDGSDFSVRFSNVHLVEPRVAYRGGPKVQQAVDSGRVVVNGSDVVFESATRHREWALSKTSGIDFDGQSLLIRVSNRTVLSGVTADAPIAYAIRSAIAFAMERRAGRDGSDVVVGLERHLDRAAIDA